MILRETLRRLGVKQAQKKAPQAASEYRDAGFRQGASIGPAMLTKVTIDERVMSTAEADDEVEVTTIRSTDKRWKKVRPLKGTVPRRWVRKLFTSKEMLAFWMHSEVGHAIVPVNEEDYLEPDPGSANDLWAEFETIYDEHRTKGTNNPKTLREGIDYGKKLSRQLPTAHDNDRRTVLYPKSSDIMRAARVAMQDEVANDTLYHWKAGSEDEAAYLVALLNAPTLSQAFLDSRQSGRDFHMHPWRKVPIPLFDAENNDHVELASLTSEAERLIEQWMSDETNTKGLKQVGLSKRIRRLLEVEGVLNRIDTIARKVLPRQTSA